MYLFYRKLSYCYIQNNDADAAYECLRKGIEDDANNKVETEDYLLFVKYALLQQQQPSQEAGNQAKKKSTWIAAYSFLL
jgi:hypothetical protein